MNSKRFSADEQFQLIMECRQSGLTDYQWCKMRNLNPSTFYNWVSRLRKREVSIPDSTEKTNNISSSIQQVVKVELLPDSNSIPMKVEQNTRFATNLSSEEPAAVEILIGNATIRFFNNTDKSLLETTLKCFGGALCAR